MNNTKKDKHSMGFTKKQEALVKDSWQFMKQNISELNLHYFNPILEIAPAGKSMFSFLNDTDEIPQNNPKFKAHVVQVFKMTCGLGVQLCAKGEVVMAKSTLKSLGSVHVQKGVIDSHFEVVKEAFLKTVKEEMGEKWSKEMNEAWAEAYDHVAAVIKTEMRSYQAAAV